MTRYIQIVQGKEAPQNRQAKELLEYAYRLYAFDRFDQKLFTRLLADQKGKDTALKGSRADPAQTWNYYRPAMHYYGHIRVFEGDTELKPEEMSTDPFNRHKGSVKQSSLSEELAKLEERIQADTKRAGELRQVIAKANQSAADLGGSGLWSPQAQQAQPSAGAIDQAQAQDTP